MSNCTSHTKQAYNDGITLIIALIAALHHYVIPVCIWVLMLITIHTVPKRIESDLVQQFSELLPPLHVSESGCVGGRDIDHNVVCKLSQLPDALDIVPSCIHTVLVLAKVYTKIPSVFGLHHLPAFQPLPYSLVTMAVEPIPAEWYNRGLRYSGGHTMNGMSS